MLAPLYRLFYRVAQWSWAWQAVRLGKAVLRRCEGAERARSRFMPGMRAMAHVVETLGIEADHVLFGHLHHPGEWTTHGGTRLVNTGTWRGPNAVAASVLVRERGSSGAELPARGVIPRQFRLLRSSAQCRGFPQIAAVIPR